MHVALGSRDDRIPAWLSEGLAEYLSVRTLPPAERVISGEALDAARAGLTALPDTATFNETDSLANYGVAWWVCEAIAETYGEQMLWTLVDELAGALDPDAELELPAGCPRPAAGARRGRADAGDLRPGARPVARGRRLVGAPARARPDHVRLMTSKSSQVSNLRQSTRMLVPA